MWFTEARADCHSPSVKPSRHSGPIIAMNVTHALSFRRFHVVSLGSGTFRQIADQVDSKIVVRQVQRMSRDPRAFGEDVHPCNDLLVLLVDINLWMSGQGMQYERTTPLDTYLSLFDRKQCILVIDM